MKIIKIIDTREQVEVESENGRTRFVGIRGTGIERTCDLCQSIHEIHVYVELDDSNIQIVGLGCGKKTWPEFEAQMKLFKDVEELNSLIEELKYKFIGKKYSDFYRGKVFEFEIDGKNYKIADMTEKGAVMFTVKKYHKAEKLKFSRYFKLKQKLEI